jgi:MFS family permease
LAPNFGVLLFARCASGIGESAVYVLTPPLIQDVVPLRHRGKWLAFFNVSVPLGFASEYQASVRPLRLCE